MLAADPNRMQVQGGRWRGYCWCAVGSEPDRRGLVQRLEPGRGSLGKDWPYPAVAAGVRG